MSAISRTAPLFLTTIFAMHVVGCIPPPGYFDEPSTAATAATSTSTSTSTAAPVPKAAEDAGPVPTDVPVATIRGVKTGYRRNSLSGGGKTFYLNMFEPADLGRTGGEVNATVKGPLVKGKPLPVQMTFLQVADNGPKSEGGVRNISAGGCSGKGTLTLDSVPKMPAKPSAGQELGAAVGKIAIDVECSFDLEKDFGRFTVAGPITMKVSAAE